ncbi:MAG: calcium/sodium antiporter [Microvirga sp.]|nr:calcium/sodium antiporter [Microvirga sp.]
MNEWFLLAAGFALLLAGGEYLVRGAVTVARAFGMSPMLIGLTLVGFGTSTPELVASVNAAMKGAPGLAVGNVVGSNIANILLILGVSAVLLPIATNREAFRRDGPALLIATAVLVAAILSGAIDRVMGVAGLALLLAYTAFTWWTDSHELDAGAAMHGQEAQEVDMQGTSLPVALAITLGGMGGVLIGADLLVDAAIVIALDFGLSEAVIGLTLVAIGTSLPELVTSVMAAIRKHADVAFGNIVGSCIFNILGILSVTALVAPLTIPAGIAAFDVWVAALAAVMLVVFAMTGWRIGRREGAILLAVYGLYIALQILPELRAALGLPAA